MGATASHVSGGGGDSAWERELGADGSMPPGRFGLSMLKSRRGGTGLSSHASAEHQKLADASSSDVHRQFTWHLAIVFGGFVAVRAAWLWAEGMKAERRRNEEAAERNRRNASSEPSTPTARRRSSNAPSGSRPTSPSRRRRSGPLSSPRRQMSDDGAFVVDGDGGGALSASYLDPKTTPTVHPFEEATANVSQGKWITVRALGHGSFGTVTLVRNVDTGVYAALKQVPVGEAGQLTREFGLLCNLKPHPHVVRVLGAAVRGHRARLFLEYCPNGSLADVMKRREPQPEPYVRSCIRQIMEGLAFLHHYNILHRDIKPANILVDASGVLKIADFGLSRHIDSLKTHTVQAGSPAYMSPESIRGQLSSGSDLWSVAATMCEMLSGELPWSHHEAFRAGKEPLLLYIGTHPGEHPDIPNHASPEAQDLLRVLFRADPKARGTAAVALLHPFFAMEAPATPLSHAASMTASVSGPGDTVPLPFHQHHHHHARGGSVSLSRQASGHTFGPPCSMEVTSNAADTPPPLAGVSGIVGCSTLHTEAGVSF